MEKKAKLLKVRIIVNNKIMGYLIYKYIYFIISSDCGVFSIYNILLKINQLKWCDNLIPHDIRKRLYYLYLVVESTG